MAAEKKLFGVDRYIDESFVTGGPQGNNSFGLYEEPPSMRDEGSQFSGMHDWRTVFRGGEVKESTPGIELLWYTTWIVPKEHGLADSADMELWRIVVANSKYITFAARLEDSHGMLPVVCATPLEDDLGNEQRTYAEKLFGLQHMSSFLMNSHQAAVRKSIGGITLYNPHVVAGMDLKRKNLIGARIPIKSTATDFDIDKVFRHYVDSASDVTGKALEHLATVDAVMQKILPTDTLKQVASLERATLYQAAATVQAGDRRNYTIACIISDQSMMPLKFMMIFNIYAKEPSVDYVDANGTRTDYAIAKLIEAGIEHYIGTGLKGLDRLMTLQIFRDVLQMVIQSQQALEELDVTQMLNYMMTLAGDNTDLTQFKRQQTEIDQLRSMRSKQPSEASVGLPGGGPTQGG
ncbi:MAG TPA: hypothetical protein VKE92_10110 [Anaerolineales bacterium]|nr:hypothetical protein [Anaerolineales bacterium]